ncbi:MAG: hypothetical protein V8Q17_08920 [Acutalibacteraceae bacterium]
MKVLLLLLSGITYYVIVDPNALITDESARGIPILCRDCRVQPRTATYLQKITALLTVSHIHSDILIQLPCMRNPIRVKHRCRRIFTKKNTVSDKVWLDSNKDGCGGGGRAEPELAGVKVELLRENGGNYEVFKDVGAVDAQGSPLTSNLTGGK